MYLQVGSVIIFEKQGPSAAGHFAPTVRAQDGGSDHVGISNEIVPLHSPFGRLALCLHGSLVHGLPVSLFGVLRNEIIIVGRRVCTLDGQDMSSQVVSYNMATLI